VGRPGRDLRKEDEHREKDQRAGTSCIAATGL
jgi:hypothetical protein